MDGFRVLERRLLGKPFERKAISYICTICYRLPGSLGKAAAGDQDNKYHMLSADPLIRLTSIKICRII
jgi:hypothetical protein